MAKARSVRGRFRLLCTEPYSATTEKKDPEGVKSLRVARALRRQSRRGDLGRGAGGPNRGRRHQWRREPLAHHHKDVLYGAELLMVLGALALRRSGSKMRSRNAPRCPPRTCTRVRGPWGRCLGCAPQPLRLLAGECAPRSIPYQMNLTLMDPLR